MRSKIVKDGLSKRKEELGMERSEGDVKHIRSAFSLRDREDSQVIIIHQLPDGKHNHGIASIRIDLPSHSIAGHERTLVSRS